MLGHVKAINAIGLSLVFVIVLPLVLNYFTINSRVINIFPEKILLLYANIKKYIGQIHFYVLFRNIIIGFISLIITAFTFYYAFGILNCYPGLIRIIIYVSFIRLLLVYHIIPWNIGIQELVFGSLTELTGLGLAVGISVSIIIRITSYFTLGVISTFFYKKVMRQLEIA
tara:strand:+ start:51 stop:560 length:510 start_codon:yes stop_codon:yes gene_type:complete